MHLTTTLTARDVRRLLLSISFDAKGCKQLISAAKEVHEMALRKGLVSVPATQWLGDRFDLLIVDGVGELILEGVFALGNGGFDSYSVNLPWFHVTEYGRSVIGKKELSAHDPEDYVAALRRGCPAIDDTTLLYVNESLKAFKHRLFLSAVVMIGIASESVLMILKDALGSTLPKAQLAKFITDTKSGNAGRVQEAIMARLRNTTLPLELTAVFEPHINGMLELIRQSRNNAGHPTGRRFEQNETHGLMLMYPTYAKTAHDLITYLKLKT